MNAAQLKAIEIDLARAMRNGEDETAFHLIERLRLARKRLAEAQQVQT